MGICSSKRPKMNSQKAGQKKRETHQEMEQIDLTLFKKSFTTDFKVGKKIENFNNLNFVTEYKTQKIRISQFIPLGSDSEAQELQIHRICQLRHPNLMEIFETHQLNNGYYLVYEHVSTDRFFDVYSKHRTKSEKIMKRVVRQLFKAVDYLHVNKFVHGNINLDHILGSTLDHIRLFGYGLNDTYHPRHQPIGQSKHHFRAPETYKGTQKSIYADIWACGMFIIYLITGRSHFNNDDEKELIQDILEREPFEFSDPHYKNISPAAIKLLESIFNAKHPQNRPTAKQILEHPWLAVKTKPAHLTKDQLQVLIPTEQVAERLDVQSVAFMVAQIYHDYEKQKLQDLFVHLDDDNSGTVSYQELMKGFSDHIKEEDKHKYCDLIFQKCGKNYKKNQQIGIWEFVSCLIDQYRPLQAKQQRKTFDIIDSDQNGLINRDDLTRNLMKFNLKPEQLKEILDMTDKDGNGQIQFKEFAVMVEKAQKYSIRQNRRKNKVRESPIKLEEELKQQLDQALLTTENELLATFQEKIKRSYPDKSPQEIADIDSEDKKQSLKILSLRVSKALNFVKYSQNQNKKADSEKNQKLAKPQLSPQLLKQEKQGIDKIDEDLVQQQLKTEPNNKEESVQRNLQKRLTTQASERSDLNSIQRRGPEKFQKNNTRIKTDGDVAEEITLQNDREMKRIQLGSQQTKNALKDVLIRRSSAIVQSESKKRSEERIQKKQNLQCINEDTTRQKPLISSENECPAEMEVVPKFTKYSQPSSERGRQTFKFPVTSNINSDVDSSRQNDSSPKKRTPRELTRSWQGQSRNRIPRISRRS